MSKGHRSEVPELYCVFASKTLRCEGPSEGCPLLRAFHRTKDLLQHKSLQGGSERAEEKAEGRAGNQSTRMSFTQRVVLACIALAKVIREE